MVLKVYSSILLLITLHGKLYKLLNIQACAYQVAYAMLQIVSVFK